MTYPTIEMNGNIHVVRDEKSCVCGFQYRMSIPEKKKDLLKPIQFKSLNTINCQKCRSIISAMTFFEEDHHS